MKSLSLSLSHTHTHTHTHTPGLIVCLDRGETDGNLIGTELKYTLKN